jgi:hypothetical protein
VVSILPNRSAPWVAPVVGLRILAFDLLHESADPLFFIGERQQVDVIAGDAAPGLHPRDHRPGYS